MIDPARAHVFDLERSADAARDERTATMRKLERHQADSARGGVDQEVLPCMQVRVLESEPDVRKDSTDKVACWPGVAHDAWRVAWRVA